MIIAIAGASQAGKSTLAERLRDLLGRERTSIICQDDFVKDVRLIPKFNDHIDWEHPDSIEHDILYSTIKAEANRYAFVIAEGLMILWDEATRKLFDKCIFLDIDQKTFADRKSKDERWGIEPSWYVEHIWQSYLKYGQVPDGYPHLKINSSQPVDISKVLNYLRE